jgi:ketosteroid isomerase-like protein
LKYELRETHGEIAYIISKYWLKATDKETGNTYLDAGRSLLVYKKQSGRWKIAADIDQSTPDVSWPAPSGLN